MRQLIVGERALIERAWKVFKRDPRELLGLDDAQAVELSGKVVFKVDVFDETTDWLPGMTLRDVGWKAVTAAVSDVLVKGARPLGVMLGVGLPEETLDAADGLFEGIEEACDKLGVRVWGGDTGSSDHLYVSVAVAGVAENLVPRSGARPGDTLMMSGHEVSTPAAYAVLLDGAEPCARVEEAIEVAYRPRLTKQEFWLEASRLATASIDDSDGLALTLHYLAEASGVRLVVEQLPLSAALLACAERWGRDPLEMALYLGGEEYNFVFTTRDPDTILELAEKHGQKVWRIGKVVEGRGVVLEGYGEVEQRGWEHFGGWTARRRASTT